LNSWPPRPNEFSALGETSELEKYAPFLVIRNPKWSYVETFVNPAGAPEKKLLDIDGTADYG